VRRWQRRWRQHCVGLLPESAAEGAMRHEAIPSKQSKHNIWRCLRLPVGARDSPADRPPPPQCLPLPALDSPGEATSVVSASTDAGSARFALASARYVTAMFLSPCPRFACFFSGSDVTETSPRVSCSPASCRLQSCPEGAIGAWFVRSWEHRSFQVRSWAIPVWLWFGLWEIKSYRSWGSWGRI